MMSHATTRSVFLAVLAIAAVAGFARADGDPVRVRVLCYNIHHGRGDDDRVDLERIARVIRSVEPDVVALQEVDRGVERSGRLDEPAELGRLTGMTPLFERNIPHQGGEYGNAVLTRLPIQGHRNVPLPALTDNEQRGVLVVDLALGDAEAPLRILATHLDHHPDDAERIASAALINELASDLVDRPSILMGDLNAVPDSRVLERLGQIWARANAEPLPTYPASTPKRQIDYILTAPMGHWRTVEVRVLDEPVASDHLPIFAVLELVEP